MKKPEAHSPGSNFIARAQIFFLQLKAKLAAYKHREAVILAAAALALWLGFLYLAFFSAPPDFPKGTIVRIKKGTSIDQAAQLLSDKKLIRYARIFSLLARMTDKGEIIAGDYRFRQSEGVIHMASRLATGRYDIEPIRLTIQEGLSSKEIGEILDKKLPVFDRERFLKIAADYEGRLFPDTYFIKPSDDEDDIVGMMLANFKEKTKEVVKLAIDKGKDFNEILTMASLIEEETRTAESRRMVSGILWNRIKKGMKLQVDAVFPYIMEKYSLQLTIKDLKYDSPYNTYLYKGLPPGPITNPGIDSIKAALEPKITKYLYYLSDRSGQMYYALTYKAHMQNRNAYLPND